MSKKLWGFCQVKKQVPVREEQSTAENSSCPGWVGRRVMCPGHWEFSDWEGGQHQGSEMETRAPGLTGEAEHDWDPSSSAQQVRRCFTLATGPSLCEALTTCILFYVHCLIKLLINSEPHDGSAFVIPSLQMRAWSTERLGNQHQVIQLVNGGAEEEPSQSGFRAHSSYPASQWWLEEVSWRGWQEAVLTTQTRSNEGLGKSSGFLNEDSGVGLRAFREVETGPGGEWGVSAVEGKEPKIQLFIHSCDNIPEGLLCVSHCHRKWLASVPKTDKQTS